MFFILQYLKICKLLDLGLLGFKDIWAKELGFRVHELIKVFRN